jgi:hypothetical protein
VSVRYCTLDEISAIMHLALKFYCYSISRVFRKKPIVARLVKNSSSPNPKVQCKIKGDQIYEACIMHGNEEKYMQHFVKKQS